MKKANYGFMEGTCFKILPKEAERFSMESVHYSAMFAPIHGVI